MEEEKKPIGTIVLAAVNIIIFLWMSFSRMTGSAVYMLDHGAMYTPYIIENGEYYRLFSCMFLHFDFTHLMNNMVTLLVLGWNLEPIVGKMKVFLIYILSGLGGNVLSLAFDMVTQNNAVSAGASGAVFGLTGALLCLAILNHGSIGNVTRQGMFAMVGISLYLGFTSVGVDNWAHVGGLLTGIIVTFLLCRKCNFDRGSLIEN